MKARILKELKSWGFIATLFLILYLTGLHTDVAAFAQRIILYTGILTPNTELPESERADVDYSFLLQDVDGKTVPLEKFKGKVIFLNLWASWCPPCIAEMPSIQDLYEKVDQENIEFVMLSMDKNPEKAVKFIDKKGFTFPVYTPASRVPDVFRAPSIPTTFVISPEGKIVAKKVGMANYNKKSFVKFLNEQIAEQSQEE